MRNTVKTTLKSFDSRFDAKEFAFLYILSQVYERSLGREDNLVSVKDLVMGVIKELNMSIGDFKDEFYRLRRKGIILIQQAEPGLPIQGINGWGLEPFKTARLLRLGLPCLPEPSLLKNLWNKK